MSFFVVKLNAQKQKGQAINATSAQKAIDIIKVSWKCLFVDTFLNSERKRNSL